MIKTLAIVFYSVDNSQHFGLCVLSQNQEGGIEAYFIDVTSKASGRIPPTKPLPAELCAQGRRTLIKSLFIHQEYFSAHTHHTANSVGRGSRSYLTAGN